MKTSVLDLAIYRTSALVALGYCALGTAWMVGSGVLDIFAAGVPRHVWTPTLVRGLAFVLLSTIALFIISIRLQRSRSRVEATLRQTTSELVQAQKLEAVGRLAASVAHDFNNVLTAIIGMAELLREDLPADSGERAEAAEIMATATRAKGLTRQLLIFSGNSEPHRVGVDINDSIVGLMPMLRTTLGPTIEMEVDMSADQPCVFMDPSRLDQVLMNLVANARDALPAGGKVVIESRVSHVGPGGTADMPDLRPGDYAILIVSDTGAGMDDDTLSRCFEPFFTTKPRGQGTGLGLATVYGIVHEAGGYLSVYSEVGAGTTFKAYIPLLRESTAATMKRVQATEKSNAARPAQAARPAGSTAASTQPSGSTRSVSGSVSVQGNGNGTGNREDEAAGRAAAIVLIVEDEASVRRVAAAAIGRAGYQVLTAASATEAAQIAQDSRIDLLFTDMVLPDESGGELAQRLIASHPDMRVLITSGYTELSVRLRPAGMLLSEGRAHFIEKPYSIGDLAARVEDVMRTPSPH